MDWRAPRTAAVFAQLRQAITRLMRRLAPPVSQTNAFTVAVVTLAAKMSMADGVSTPAEAAAFERVFKVPARQAKRLRAVFALASRNVAGYETIAERAGRLLENEPELRVTVLECLFYIASADGVLHPAEDAFLETVAKRLGLTCAEYRTVRRAFIHDPDSPYEILGLAPDASDAELRRRYLQLVRDHHPDALVAKGVPPEYLCAAGRRLAAINVAHEAIVAERQRTGAPALEAVR